MPGALLQHFRTRQAPGMFTLQCQEFTESRGEQKNSSSQLPPCWIKALQKDVARLPDKPPSLHRKSCEGRLLKFIGYSNRGGQSGHTSSKLDSWRVWEHQSNLQSPGFCRDMTEADQHEYCAAQPLHTFSSQDVVISHGPVSWITVHSGDQLIK